MESSENRWLVVAGALIIQVCLGAIYSWSVFVNPLKEVFFYTTTQTQIIFSLALATFALVMIFAGRLQDRRGPRLVATLGGVVLGGGYLLASLTGGSFPLVALTVGIIGGAGIGLAYVCPIAACVKWFPDKRGMVTGLAVAGFGAGAWLSDGGIARWPFETCWRSWSMKIYILWQPVPTKAGVGPGRKSPVP